MLDTLEKELLHNDFEGDAKYDPRDVGNMKGVKHSQNDDSNNENVGVEHGDEKSDNEPKVDLCDKYSSTSKSDAK